MPLIIGTFIVAQVPLHRKIVAHKRAELDRIDQVLESCRPRSLEAVDEEMRKNVEFFLKQRELFSALPNWPFNLRTLAGAGVSVLTALSPVGFQFVTAMLGLGL